MPQLGTFPRAAKNPRATKAPQTPNPRSPAQKAMHRLLRRSRSRRKEATRKHRQRAPSCALDSCSGGSCSSQGSAFCSGGCCGERPPRRLFQRRAATPPSAPQLPSIGARLLLRRQESFPMRPRRLPARPHPKTRQQSSQETTAPCPQASRSPPLTSSPPLTRNLRSSHGPRPRRGRPWSSSALPCLAKACSATPSGTTQARSSSSQGVTPARARREAMGPVRSPSTSRPVRR